MNRNDRPYDVVLLGATGFTGRLVAEYMLATYGNGGKLSWALAGRNQAKLEKVRGELQRNQPEVEIPILVADSANAAQLQELAANARVICSTFSIAWRSAVFSTKPAIRSTAETASSASPSDSAR